MTAFDFDLFVIGGGSGGVRAARAASSRGARVALAEISKLGGTCVNAGCIPKKIYSYAAGYSKSFDEAAGYGWKTGLCHFDWDKLKSQRASEIRRLNGVYQSMLDGLDVCTIQGHTRLVDAHTVEVNGTHYRAHHIVVATGSTPNIPHISGREHAVVSDAMFDLENLPKDLLVIGGGYIACEFASIFSDLGVKVTIAVRKNHILHSFDEDVRIFLAREMSKGGINIRLNSEVVEIKRDADGLLVALDNGQALRSDVVLFATGRMPNTDGLNLAGAGVAVDDNGRIKTDMQHRTSVSSIYAIGDVSTSIQLTPVALAEAMALVEVIFPESDARTKWGRMNYEYIPTAVFTHPNLGICGYTEADAREKFGDVSVYATEFKALRQSVSGSSERTYMKLVVDTKSDRVVGLHIACADAGEIVQGFAVAMRAGATKAMFDTTLGIHPTLAEELVTMRQPVRR